MGRCLNAAPPQDGSLRIVRNGIGINEQATVELPGIKGMWSLRTAATEPYDRYLLVTFISETRILAINTDEELEETEIVGFASNEQTVFCFNSVHDQLVQVMVGLRAGSQAVRLLWVYSGRNVPRGQLQRGP